MLFCRETRLFPSPIWQKKQRPLPVQVSEQKTMSQSFACAATGTWPFAPSA
ncbi:MAG TPA: hypothetical protein VKV19_19825 [Ktedonobacteraceae bacterium]|nr:hypothetical protein [Ktedonobacteraceae bacterium]